MGAPDSCKVAAPIPTRPCWFHHAHIAESEGRVTSGMLTGRARCQQGLHHSGARSDSITRWPPSTRCPEPSRCGHLDYS